MAVAVDLDASRRLLERIENLQVPSGEGMAADVRSPVPREVADAFRALIEAPAASAPESASAASSVRSPDALGAAQNGSIGIDSVGSDLASDRAGAVSADDLMNPMQFLSTQFSVNMHAFEMKSVSGARDRMVEDLETTMKSSS